MPNKSETCSSPIICIGGANIDRKFFVKNDLMIGTSNPITSSASVGGVARNIAENLGRLGEEVILLTVRGEDSQWTDIEASSKDFMDLSYVEVVRKSSTGSYTAVINHEGDMTVAYADMDIFESLSPSFLKGHEAVLITAKCLVIDLNCPKESIEYIHEISLKHDIPLVIIPVSSPKMKRLSKNIQEVNWLIVNRDETETFLKQPISNEKEWGEAVTRWLDCGYEHVVVTNGSKGVMAAKRGMEPRHFPPILADHVIDVTGAGDSFCAAVIYSWLAKEDFDASIRAGLVNARQTILSAHTVRKELTKKQLEKEMEEFI